MTKLQEKLDFLLDKYSVDAKATIINSDKAIVNANEAPLLSYRYERRFIELKNIVQGGTLEGVSVMRVARIVEKGKDLFEVSLLSGNGECVKFLDEVYLDMLVNAIDEAVEKTKDYEKRITELFEGGVCV